MEFMTLMLNSFCELTLIRVILVKENSSPIETLDYINNVDSFPNACIAYKILLFIPITVASAEKSFSKLKLIKS